MTVAMQDLLLAKAAHWEATTPDKVFMTQPHSGGQTTDYTWRQTMDEARRMATHLIGLNLPKPSQIAAAGVSADVQVETSVGLWRAPVSRAGSAGVRPTNRQLSRRLPMIRAPR